MIQSAGVQTLASGYCLSACSLLFILENQRVSGNHWLTVNTVGSTSNRDGIGTQVRLVTEFGQE